MPAGTAAVKGSFPRLGRAAGRWNMPGLLDYPFSRPALSPDISSTPGGAN